MSFNGVTPQVRGQCTNIFNKLNTKETLDQKFFEFVFTKISRNTKNRFVEKGTDCIDIIPVKHEAIRVIPIFKDMDKNNLSLQYEVTKATNIIQNGDIKYIYFVYPRNENFDKHIEIKVPLLEETCGEYMIKIIPYSLNDLYKKERCNGSSNILCK